MNKLLKSFRTNLADSVLTFLWEQWSRIGAMASGATSEQARIIDPESLLLVTLECARQDPRVFDAVMDWLVTNGKWINVTRLTTLLKEDQNCEPRVMGAVAATLAEHDRTPKWRTMARLFLPRKPIEPEPFFQKYGRPLLGGSRARDKHFAAYGLLREPLRLRDQSSAVPMANPSNLVFRARALFGVNIRADVFAFLMVAGACNPSRLAHELGYSQRRVQDALVEMAAADLFLKVRSDRNRKEYFVDSAKGMQLLFGPGQPQAAWFNWRAFARGTVRVWRVAFGLREVGLTSYILESELGKAFRNAESDLLAIGINWPTGGSAKSFLASAKNALSARS